MGFGYLKPTTEKMAATHLRRDYAKRVFDRIIDAADDDRYVTVALPIANYAVDHLNLSPSRLVTKLVAYVKEHTVSENGTLKIVLPEETNDKYPIDNTAGSKLIALACEFVENNK